MSTDTEKADTISRRRAQYMPFLAVLLLAQQSLFISWDGRAVTLVQTVAWIVLALVVLFAIVTGGNWFASARVRALANDGGRRPPRAGPS